MAPTKTFLLIFLSLFYFSTAFADEMLFAKDQSLVDKLKQNQVRLIVMRQAEATNNSKKIVASSNTPGFCLTAKGIAGIEDLVSFYRSQNIYKIFTSPLYRCLQSTQMIGEKLDIPVDNLIIDDRLVIQQFGIYESLPYSIYNDLFLTQTLMLEAGLANMESGADVFQRTHDFLWHIADNVFDKTILVITHAFNYCHISKCLTGNYKMLPYPAGFVIYDFAENSEKATFFK